MDGEAEKTREVARFRQLVEQDPYLVDEVSFAYSRNLLHIAAMHGQAGIVEEVLKVTPQLARELNSQKSSPLHVAAAKGYVKIVALLVRVAPEMCWWRDGQGINPVHVAAINGHVEVLEELLRLDLSPARERLHRGQTILHLCVKHDQISTLQVLMKDIWDLVDAEDDDGNTVLDWAVRCRRYEMEEYLGKTTGAKWLPRNYVTNMLKELTQVTETTKVVVILIATMAFQAVVSPPGGFWQEDTSSHRAGESVMASTYPKIYKHFVRANTTAFLSSLLTIYLITTRKPSKKTVFMRLAVCATWVSLASIIVSYGASVVVLTPNAGTKSLHPIIVAVVVVSLGLTILPQPVYYCLLRPSYSLHRTWKENREEAKKRRELELGDLPNQHEEE